MTTYENDPEAARLAKKFYSPVSHYRRDLEPGVNRLRDAAGMDAEEAAHVLEGMAQVFDDAKISDVRVVRNLHSILVDHQINPASADTVFQWSEESQRMIRENYGTRAEFVLGRVREFVEWRPELAPVAMHPKFVEALAENVNSLRVEPTWPEPKPAEPDTSW